MLLDRIYDFLPLLILMSLSNMAYFKIDKKFNITEKISSILPMDYKWKEAFCLCCIMVIIMYLGLFSRCIIEIPSTLFSGITGILTGTGLALSSELSVRKKLK